MRIEKIDALQQRHRVRVHLLDSLEPDPGQRHQVLPDMQVILPGHLKTAVMQNTQIGQNTSRDRVLDRHDTVLGSAALDLPGHFAERIAGNDFRPLAQKATRDDMMETTFVALNGDARSHAAHSLRLRPFVLACHLHFKKNPGPCKDRDRLSFHRSIRSLKATRSQSAFGKVEVKIITKKRRKLIHRSS